MYPYLFDVRGLTVGLACALSVLACLTASRTSLWWRSILFSFVPSFAAAFFALAAFAPLNVSGLDILGGFLFEFFVLLLFCHLLRRQLLTLHTIPRHATERSLRLSVPIQVVLCVLVASSDGFGIFSEGSRIDYLSSSALAKYYTYGVFMVAGVQSGLLARHISLNGTPGRFGLVVLAVNFVFSLLSGSKGSVFLWFGMVLAQIDYRRARIPAWLVVLSFSILAGAIGSTAVIAAKFLDISIAEFFDLAVNRFFLSNDARALAFDVRRSAGGSGLLSETFRSLANLADHPPVNPPVGIYLYENYFGASGGNGANGSLAALLALYFPPGYMIIPASASMALAGALTLSLLAVTRRLRNARNRYVVLATGITCLLQLSQDFLAFQVVMPIALLIVVATWHFDRRNAPSRARKPTRGAGVA